MRLRPVHPTSGPADIAAGAKREFDIQQSADSGAAPGKPVYGMTFEDMPELEWLLGYPFALGLMLAAAILPYLFFKHRGWL